MFIVKTRLYLELKDISKILANDLGFEKLYS